MANTILVINGPNLGRLGRRQTGPYGTFTLQDVQQRLEQEARASQSRCLFFQADGEGELVTRIGRAADEGVDGIVINAGAYTHTSIAIRDALLDFGRPFVEVHISNVFAREPFRHHSYLSDIAVGVVCGFGLESYLLGLHGLLQRLNDESPSPA